MRYGFTTGSCSAAAAKAAAYMLLSGKTKENICITTPKGIDFNASIVDIDKEERYVKCAVIKDGGDDPDVTTGAYVYAKVILVDEGNEIIIDGEEGVGRVTKPGLDQEVGNAAINSVPRQMIEKEVREVMEFLDYNKSLKVLISVKDGEEIAKKTFNPRLGIVGGISILGTSGIVEPMSTKAILDTIRVELNQKKAMGYKNIVISPGNYGLDFMKDTYGYDLERAVKCSNYIGDTLDLIGEIGFEEVLLCGHIGKLIKVSGGIMNTHSKEADCRMELMVSAGVKVNISPELLIEALECVSTDSAYSILKQSGKEKEMMDIIMDRIDYYLNKRVAGRFNIECIVFSNEHGLLGKSNGAEELIKKIIGEDIGNE